MSNSGGKITAPVSIEDVRTVLGVSSYDLGTLCKNSNGKINKWSKYKPVRQPFVVAPNSNWYKANDGFCGLKVGWSTAGDSSLTNLVNAYKQGTWDYLPPTGGDSQPFRLLDFEGYDHNAGPFVSSKMKKGTELKVNTMASNALTLAVTYNSSSTSLQITDFGNATAISPTVDNLMAASIYYKQPSGSKGIYRATDFNGYYHGANPIFSFTLPSSASPDAAIIINVNALLFETSTSGGKNNVGKIAYTNCYIYNTKTGSGAGKLLEITLVGST